MEEEEEKAVKVEMGVRVMEGQLALEVLESTRKGHSSFPKKWATLSCLFLRSTFCTTPLCMLTKQSASGTE